ncbi:hypothetical protein PCE1_003564 [Barthelona sp. PCE]
MSFLDIRMNISLVLLVVVILPRVYSIRDINIKGSEDKASLWSRVLSKTDKEGEWENAYDFIPTYAAHIRPHSDYHLPSNLGTCFDNINIHVVLESDRVKVTVKLSDPRKKTCSERLLFQTLTLINTRLFFRRGTHNFVFKNVTQGQKTFIETHGLIVSVAQRSFPKSIKKIYKLYRLFSGKLKDSEMFEYYRSFGYALEPRYHADRVLPKSLIPNGAVFFSFYPSVTDAFLLTFTENIVAHAAVAFWDDGELYIVESTFYDDESMDLKGIFRMPYDEWIELQTGDDTHIVMVRLKQHYQQQLESNMDAVWEYFHDHVSPAYAFKNFYYSEFSCSGGQHTPANVHSDSFSFLLSMVHRFAPELCQKHFSESIGSRLGISEANVTCDILLHSMEEQGTSLAQILSSLEPDESIYNDGFQMHCGAIVYKLLSVGVEDLRAITANFFDPPDISYIDIYDTEYVYPADHCPDSTNGVCQFYGKYKFDLRSFSSVPINRFRQYSIDKCLSSFPRTH